MILNFLQYIKKQISSPTPFSQGQLIYQHLRHDNSQIFLYVIEGEVQIFRHKGSRNPICEMTPGSYLLINKHPLKFNHIKAKIISLVIMAPALQNIKQEVQKWDLMKICQLKQHSFYPQTGLQSEIVSLINTSILTNSINQVLYKSDDKFMGIYIVIDGSYQHHKNNRIIKFEKGSILGFDQDQLAKGVRMSVCVTKSHNSQVLLINSFMLRNIMAFNKNFLRSEKIKQELEFKTTVENNKFRVKNLLFNKPTQKLIKMKSFLDNLPKHKLKYVEVRRIKPKRSISLAQTKFEIDRAQEQLYQLLVTKLRLSVRRKKAQSFDFEEEVNKIVSRLSKIELLDLVNQFQRSKNIKSIKNFISRLK